MTPPLLWLPGNCTKVGLPTFLSCPRIDARNRSQKHTLPFFGPSSVAQSDLHLRCLVARRTSILSLCFPPLSPPVFTAEFNCSSCPCLGFPLNPRRIPPQLPRTSLGKKPKPHPLFYSEGKPPPIFSPSPFPALASKRRPLLSFPSVPCRKRPSMFTFTPSPRIGFFFMIFRSVTPKFQVFSLVCPFVFSRAIQHLFMFQ